MTRIATLTALAALIATPALADFETRRSVDDVQTVMTRLEDAAREAGATVFARVDHGAGAAGVDMRLDEAQLLIFGNPRLGTPAMQDDMRAGLMLPMRVLVYDDDGETVILWQDPDEMFDDLDMDDDAEYLDAMEEALENLAVRAAGPGQ